VQAIVITTTPDSNCLSNLLGSLGKPKYPVVILSDYSYELGKIRFVFEHTDIDEFVLLHDSCEIKDETLFDLAFTSSLSMSFSASPTDFGSYLGKYQREVLSKTIIPTPTSKLEAVEYEQLFNKQYCLKAGEIAKLEPQLVNSDVFIDKFGKKMMVLENKYLIKYKSCWTRNQLT